MCGNTVRAILANNRGIIRQDHAPDRPAHDLVGTDGHEVSALFQRSLELARRDQKAHMGRIVDEERADLIGQRAKLLSGYGNSTLLPPTTIMARTALAHDLARARDVELEAAPSVGQLRDVQPDERGEPRDVVAVVAARGLRLHRDRVAGAGSRLTKTAAFAIEVVTGRHSTQRAWKSCCVEPISVPSISSMKRF